MRDRYFGKKNIRDFDKHPVESKVKKQEDNNKDKFLEFLDERIKELEDNIAKRGDDNEFNEILNVNDGGAAIEIDEIIKPKYLELQKEKQDKFCEWVEGFIKDNIDHGMTSFKNEANIENFASQLRASLVHGGIL